MLIEIKKGKTKKKGTSGTTIIGKEKFTEFQIKQPVVYHLRKGLHTIIVLLSSVQGS